MPSLFSNVSRKNEIIKTGLKRRISYSINKIKYIHVILKPKQEISVRWAHFFLISNRIDREIHAKGAFVAHAILHLNSFTYFLNRKVRAHDHEASTKEL